MGEVPAPRKKALIKKLVDRKDRRIEVERGEEKPSKWREEKKAAPVKMKKTRDHHAEGDQAPDQGRRGDHRR